MFSPHYSSFIIIEGIIIIIITIQYALLYGFKPTTFTFLN